MRLTILGSGTNVHPKRAAAGYLVETDSVLQLDFGPRTLMNLIRTGLDRHRLTHVLFSHYHADHFSDFITYLFDEMIFTKYQGGNRPPLTVIGPPGTRTLFRTIFGILPGFDRLPFAIRYKEVSDQSFRIGNTKVIARRVTHSPNLHCLGYRVEYKGKALAYSGDSQYCDSLVRLSSDVDLAVLDCSFPASQPNPVHLHAGQCGLVAKEASAGRLVLSHFYPSTDRHDVRGQAAESFSGPIVVGRDRMVIRI